MITTHDNLEVHPERNGLAARLRRLGARLRAGLRRRPAPATVAAPGRGNEDTTVPRTVVLPLEVDRDLAEWVRDTTLRGAARQRRGAVGSHA